MELSLIHIFRAARIWINGFYLGHEPSAYATRFREEHARSYRLVNPRDTAYLRSEGWISRMIDRMRGEEYVKRRIYDTIQMCIRDRVDGGRFRQRRRSRRQKIPG